MRGFANESSCERLCTKAQVAANRSSAKGSLLYFACYDTAANNSENIQDLDLDRNRHTILCNGMALPTY